MDKKYKIEFWKSGNLVSITIEAENKSQALSWCEKSVVDNLESIHEVKN